MTSAWELRLGDCLHPETGMASLADKSVDHVITDPPYSKAVVTSAKGARRGGFGEQKTRDLGYAGLSHHDRVATSEHLGRIGKRWIVVFCDAESLYSWRLGIESTDARHVRMGAWVMPNCTPQFTGDRPGTGWEACEIAHGPGKSRWNGGGLPAVWIEPRPVNNGIERESTGHPTPKPLGLMEKLIRQFTDPGDLILDPFAGSGTTGVAAIRLGRRFIGFEKDPKYFEIARRRLMAAKEQLEVFSETRTFVEKQRVEQGVLQLGGDEKPLPKPEGS